MNGGNLENMGRACLMSAPKEIDLQFTVPNNFKQCDAKNYESYVKTHVGPLLRNYGQFILLVSGVCL